MKSNFDCIETDAFRDSYSLRVDGMLFDKLGYFLQDAAGLLCFIYLCQKISDDQKDVI